MMQQAVHDHLDRLATEHGIMAVACAVYRWIAAKLGPVRDGKHCPMCGQRERKR